MRKIGSVIILIFVLSQLAYAQQAGDITTIAGTGVSGFSGDGGPADQAQLNLPLSVVVDDDGNLFIADTDNHRVRKVNILGDIITIAGTGAPGFSGDGGPATQAQLWEPFRVFLDTNGNLYIVDRRNHRVRKVVPGIDGEFNGDNDEIITTIAGTGVAGFNGDNILSTLAQLNFPNGGSIDSFGNICIADTNNQRIRKVDNAGLIKTVAGTNTGGYSGDGGPATQAQLLGPSTITFDHLGNLFIADNSNTVVRKVIPGNDGEINGGGDEIISTVAGTGFFGYSGDGGPATLAQLSFLTGIDFDNLGNLYIADGSNHRVRMVIPGGDGEVAGDNDEIITTIAGTGVSGFSGDGGPADQAQLNQPRDIINDSEGNLYIADAQNHRVRKIFGELTEGPPGDPTCSDGIDNDGDGDIDLDDPECVAPFLSFPLYNKTPYDAVINTVFDHSMDEQYCPDEVVTSYNDEEGRSEFGISDFFVSFRDCDGDGIKEPLHGFKNEGGIDFSLGGQYSGGGEPNFLFYNGHPGYDYRTKDQLKNGSLCAGLTLCSKKGRTPVLAAASGIVTCAKKHGCPEGPGEVKIDHENGYFTIYLHLSKIKVKVDQEVSKGQEIGLSGDKGSKRNPHLHFEVRKNIDGILIPVDPYGWEGVGADPYTRAFNVNLWE